MAMEGLVRIFLRGLPYCCSGYELLSLFVVLIVHAGSCNLHSTGTFLSRRLPDLSMAGPVVRI